MAATPTTWSDNPDGTATLYAMRGEAYDRPLAILRLDDYGWDYRLRLRSGRFGGWHDLVVGDEDTARFVTEDAAHRYGRSRA